MLDFTAPRHCGSPSLETGQNSGCTRYRVDCQATVIQ